MPSSTWTIPEPPSANRIWRKSRGRIHRSREYVAWTEAALWELARQGKATFGDLPVRVRIVLPAKMRGDTDNRCKAALDMLQRGRVIADDKQVRELTVSRGETNECRITVETLEATCARSVG